MNINLVVLTMRMVDCPPKRSRRRPKRGMINVWVELATHNEISLSHGLPGCRPREKSCRALSYPTGFSLGASVVQGTPFARNCPTGTFCLADEYHTVILSPTPDVTLWVERCSVRWP